MPAGHLVVVAGKGPAYALAPGPRDAGAETTAGAEYADDLPNRSAIVRDMLEHLAADHRIEAVVGKGQVEGIAGQQREERCRGLTPRGSSRRPARRPAARSGVFPLCRPQGLEFVATGARRCEIVEGQVDADRIDAVHDAGRNDMPTLAAAEIQHAIAGPQGQEVPVDGLHR